MSNATTSPAPVAQRCAWVLWGAVILITAIAAWLRIAHLGDRGLPGDELEMWRFCKSGVSSWGILRGEVEHPMLKFMPATIKAFQELFHLEPTPFAIRLPGTLIGLLCIPVMFLVGRRMHGPAGGLVAAALLAVHPVHIQCSMEAYPYVLSITGFGLGFLVALASLEAYRTGRNLGLWAYAVLFLSVVLQIHSSIAAWPSAALVLVAALGPLAWRARRTGWRGLIPIGILVALALLAGGHIGWLVIANFLSRSSVEYGHASYQSGIRLLDPEGLRFLTNFAWGATPLRATLLALVLLCSCVAFRRRRREPAMWIALLLLVLGFLATMVARYYTRNPFEARMLAPLILVYQLLLTAGILLPFQSVWLRQRLSPALRGIVLAAWLFLLAGPLLGPATLATRIQGIPFPYPQTVAWADANLGPRAPVLTDRYFDAYNEFIVNPSTNVVFMSTVPNEPLERFQQIGWHDTARDFLERNPDAAFYEAKMFWERLGVWEWPHEFFARHQRFQDPYFTALNKLGLAYRAIGHQYSIDDIPRRIYYNTTEDLIAKARAEGRQSLFTFGEGWDYVKTQDLRDWRMLRDEATLILMNLSEAVTNVVIHLDAVAAGADKTIQAPAGAAITFPAGRPVRASLGPVALNPGRNRVLLHDPRWSEKQSPLLVHRVTLAPAEAP
ncbi:MAG: glycosyltransferase family 39 protein [Verrucomicrobia bacterium]|nr:glycosyltransferase family 39 protein [Verrucomicrobiota bacterium]